MQRILSLLLVVITLWSCNDENSKNKIYLSDSNGNLNHLSVVTDNESWNGAVGETIRTVFAAPVDGLPQKEPLFNINQIPTSVFSDFATKNRIILKIEKGDAPKVIIKRNVYAKPQKVVIVQGKDPQQISRVLIEKKDKIINALKAEEITERQRLIAKSLSEEGKSLKDSLGISIKFPSFYRIAKATDDFFWLRRDINTGTLNVMVYEIPMDRIKNDSTIIQQVIGVRDSIGKQHIPGPTEGSFMKTEEAYSPFFYTTTLDKKPTLEMRGTWDVDGAWMAGPFTTFLIKDIKNNRYVAAEGFAFAPSVNKRDYMFELEAIIKSIKVLE
jgi:hypothetical protein